MAETKHLENFLKAVHSVHQSAGGTKETSYYTALNNLLDSVGEALKPKVRCVMQLASLGAGNPDGGLFTADQFDRKTSAPTNPAAPARGVIEVKAPNEEVDFTVASTQVAKYWDRYRLVLVTNMRDWLLIGERDGIRVPLERYNLELSESAFWALAAAPSKAQERYGQTFAEFLLRVMLHDAPLREPSDLAWLLASYAREASSRIEHAGPNAQKQLTSLKESLETALGVTFDAKDGEHFFRSTLVQTLFYGLFAAWVLRHQRGELKKFNWKTAAYDLSVPMISALFEQLSQPTKLKALDLTTVLDWSADALNRVEAEAFFKKFEAEDSVQYFYEPFLKAFDPELRKQLGVWYTPREIVRYQVARVDEALRTQLGLTDGLADPSVVVLDPCCGTGAYLVEVLATIGQRLSEQGNGALAGQELKQAARQRIFGFELLPAPFVVAHLQLGLLLHKLGAPLDVSDSGPIERVSVYLTNALTGWDPLNDPKNLVLPFPELAAERDAANAVKRNQTILVILGNPPYNGFAGVAIQEERNLSDAYRDTINGPSPQGQGLNDLYVRFFRMAERQIVERSGQGIVCYVSNNSWLDGSSHPAMRERFLGAFNDIRIDNLNGDKFRTGKMTPSGEPDPSAFSTPQNREGIQVGTAIATLVRRAESSAPGEVHIRDWWGRTKLSDLASSSSSLDGLDYLPVVAQQALGWALTVQAASQAYLSWPTLPELFPLSASGVNGKRDSALVDIQRPPLVARITRYFDGSASEVELRETVPALMRDSNRFSYKDVRDALIKRGLLEKNFVPFLYRPFDLRWTYWEPETRLVGEKSAEFFAQVFDGNYWLFTTGRTRKGDPEPAIVSTRLADLNLMDSGARGTPLYVRRTHTDLLGESVTVTPNLSASAQAYIDSLAASPEDLFFHAVAVSHSSTYRRSNASALRQGWPRFPLPTSLTALQVSAALGRQVAYLLDIEHPVVGVTAGTIRPELRNVAAFSRADGKPIATKDFALTAGWGFAGQGGVVMPGRGMVERRASTQDELSLGDHTNDIFANTGALWRHVPRCAWDYTLGGYQVLKKWLSYREQDLLGRPLSLDEIKSFSAVARRITALTMLSPSLETNYASLLTAS